MPKPRKIGRRKGGKKRGYYFRSGRGWYALDEQKNSHKLCDEHGEHLRDKNTAAAVLNDAYERWRLTQAAEKPKVPATNYTVQDICAAYLRQCKATDRPKTFTMRVETLYDFCTGFPPRFRDADPDGTKTPGNHRIHKGFGDLEVSKLIRLHLDEWVAAHENWNGGKRTHIQAVKRAFNYAVEAGMIPANPLRGYKVSQSNARKTYIAPEQEQAMYANCKAALGTAIRVCIRTGARPGSEFAKLTARHVTDHGDRMEWRFGPEESKTHKLRIIRITDPAIMEIVRRQVERFPEGPVFRNTRGGPWTYRGLKEAFTRLRKRLQAKGIEIDPGVSMYSCRHTYAKRTLQGFWTGSPTNIETLCKLMGNSRDVCWKHYADWCDQYTEPLWKAC
jgi:integrase